MKVVREKGVLSTLLRVLSSPQGRASIEYISLTQLEKDELQNEHGIVFSAHVDISGAGDMWLEGYDIEEPVFVRIEAQDRHTRARKEVKGNGSERTR